MTPLGRLPPSVALLALLSVAACSDLQASFPHSASPTTSLRLHGQPAEAMVVIDDNLVGPLAVLETRGVALPAGTHQISIEAPGYFPVDRLVEAPSGGGPRIEMSVELLPVPR
jgi:hypothetical protein